MNVECNRGATSDSKPNTHHCIIIVISANLFFRGEESGKKPPLCWFKIFLIENVDIIFDLKVMKYFFDHHTFIASAVTLCKEIKHTHKELTKIVLFHCITQGVILSLFYNHSSGGANIIVLNQMRA